MKVRLAPQDWLRPLLVLCWLVTLFLYLKTWQTLRKTDRIRAETARINERIERRNRHE